MQNYRLDNYELQFTSEREQNIFLFCKASIRRTLWPIWPRVQWIWFSLASGIKQRHVQLNTRASSTKFIN